MNKIVVTGGLGFLGQYLVSALLDKYPDSEITVTARSQRKIFMKNISDALNRNRIEIIYNTDLLDPGGLENAFKDKDAVFHTAAMISFSRKDKKNMFRQNIEGTKNILDLCRKNNISKLVYVSSTAALGYSSSKDIPADENLKFDWSKAGKYSYAYSKHLAEEEVINAAALSLPAVTANISSIYGPGDEKIRPLLESLKNRRIPAMMPGGLACIDVRDAASGLIFLMEKGKPKERYILTGGNYTYEKLFSTIADSLGVPAPGKTFSMGMGKIMMPVISMLETMSPVRLKITSEIFDMGFVYRYFSTKKAESELLWKPRYTLEQTFADIAAEYQKKTKDR